MYKIWIGGVIREMTAEEQAEHERLTAGAAPQPSLEDRVCALEKAQAAGESAAANEALGILRGET